MCSNKIMKITASILCISLFFALVCPLFYNYLFKRQYQNTLYECYFESEQYAGFNSYPIFTSFDMQTLHDAAYIANELVDQTNQNKIYEFCTKINSETLENFYDQYLFFETYIILEKKTLIKSQVENFLLNHFDSHAGMFYWDNPSDSLEKKLTATLYCIKLLKEFPLTDIDISNI